MKQQQHAKKDNLFLYSNQTIRQKRVSLVASLILQCLLVLAIAFGVYAWLVNDQFKLSMRQQADAVGQSLLTQTAERAAELLAIDDKLGLNILLGSLAKNPLVADVGIYDGEGNELFRAGLKQFTHTNKTDLYKEKLAVQKQPNVELRLRLNHQQFQLPWVVSIERAIIIAGILLVAVLIFIFRLGRKITVPIAQLREWVRDPVMPVPASDRQDEIGALARELQTKLITAEEIEAYYAQFIEPEPEVVEAEVVNIKQAEDELTDSNFDQSFLDEIACFDSAESTDKDIAVASDSLATDKQESESAVTIPPPTQTAVLYIRLGGQDKLKLLSKERLINLLQRYRDCLDQTVRIYKGEIHTLNDGSSLVLFHGRGNDTDTYLTHAICCGELMRGLSHELQVELADTNITLLLQIALAQGTDLLGLTPQELLENATIKLAQSLVDHSRNLLLMDQSVASDERIGILAKIRGLANPTDTFCIERVLEPYAEVLEKQLRNMRNNKL
ncbi:histidine kinase [Entomomonas asaccharolytica]|uniref:Histidine kinase n=1 Tax=Entomomonas asaccharolytica TaxID=2785331 RepID=A0A974NG74_9GAMM|nr:histidine kinase [Entomomonas asaccharolytica]QQP85914.1 histidine kinase [Entomomonas asaccharolytica]